MKGIEMGEKKVKQLLNYSYKYSFHHCIIKIVWSQGGMDHITDSKTKEG